MPFDIPRREWGSGSMGKLSGRVAMVTGAGRGMGKAIAQELARDGAAVAIVDINETTSLQVAAELSQSGTMARGYRADVSRKDDVDGTLGYSHRIDFKALTKRPTSGSRSCSGSRVPPGQLELARHSFQVKPAKGRGRNSSCTGIGSSPIAGSRLFSRVSALTTIPSGWSLSSPYRSRSRSTTVAALRPGRPLTYPPGWLPLPQR